MTFNVLLALWVVLFTRVSARRLSAETDSCNATAATWNYDECETGLYDYTGGFIGGSTGSMSPALATVLPSTGASNALDAAVQRPAAGAGGSAATAESGTLGFATGGAQDIENFRENIDSGYLPLPTDLTYEGLVKDYEFDTTSNTTKPCTKLFCPIYSVGLSPDPLLGGGNSTLYMAVGLDSGMQAADFARKQLNLVVVLDVSGSMGESFDQYYYDGASSTSSSGTSGGGGDPEGDTKKKIDVAKEVLSGIVGLLKPEDSLSVVLFSDGACVPKPLGPVHCTDVEALQKQIDSDVVETSGTNFQAGIDAGGAQLTGCTTCMEANASAVENRIIFLTDAQPNAGDDSESGLVARVKALSADGIYTTIIGVGLDFNSQLVEAITKVRGANYFSVHTPGEFKRRLVDEFDFAVTPLVFDLSLRVRVSPPSDGNGESKSSGWQILHVYGSPNTNASQLSSDGTVMKIHTLFPSPKSEEGIKGGVVLLRMQRPSDPSTPLILDASYEDREGNKLSSVRTVDVPVAVLEEGGAEFYQSSGVEKAVALARYTDILQSWLLDEWSSMDPSEPILIPEYDCTAYLTSCCPVPPSLYGPKPASTGCTLDHWLLPDGCVLPPPGPLWPTLSGRWERRSVPLMVSPQAGASLAEFLPYMKDAEESTGDSGLEQEVKLLKKLISRSGAGADD